MKPDDWYENNITKERYWKDGSGEIAGYINKGSSFQDGSLTYAADGYIYDDSASGGGKAIENGRLHGIEEVTIWSAGAIAQKNRQEARSRLRAAEAEMFGKYALGMSVGYSFNNVGYDLSYAHNIGTGQGRIFGTNTLTTGGSNGFSIRLFQMNAYGNNLDGSPYTNVFEGATGPSTEFSGSYIFGGGQGYSSKDGIFRDPSGTTVRSINLNSGYEGGMTRGNTKDLTPAFNRFLQFRWIRHNPQFH